MGLMDEKPGQTIEETPDNLGFWGGMAMRRRSIGIFLLVLILMGGLMLRLYDLSGQDLSQAADRQAGLTVTVANARGTIYDANLRPLVNAGTEYRVSLTASPEALAAVSSCMDAGALEALTERLQEGKPVAAVLDSLPAPADGLAMFETPVRYTEPLLAPHILGYLDGDGLHGATGAELVFDERLNACAGKAETTYTVDATGRPLQGIAPTLSNTLDRAKAGVALTIDADIQKIVENAARQYLQKGAVVVMEPSTGRIAAMVSLPDFQPSTVAENLNNTDAPLLNRALCNYNCGSVFKIVTAAAAIEAGTPLSTSFDCAGSVDVGGITFHCHNRLGHGSLNLTQAFAQSCNPYFIRLAQRIGGQTLYNMAVSLRFDRPILLAEGWKTARAVLPSETELLSPAAVANLSFGQGTLMATPVHITQLVAAVVNDGNIVRPTLLRGMVDENGILTEEPSAPAQTAFSASTARILRDLMKTVVEEGTGRSARPFELGAGGKTGTAETGWEQNGKEVVQSWFGGFYPAENPEYAVVVLAEDAENTDGKSSPVFKKICEELTMLQKERALAAKR